MDVITAPHPRGQAGIDTSLEHVRAGAVEDRGDPKVREWAFAAIQAAGTPQDAVGKAQALLTAMRGHFHYISDPVDLEFIASTRMTLCLDGAELCYRGGDCFPEGTYLLKRDGHRKVQVPIEEIRIGDSIWGLDRWSLVENVWNKGELPLDLIVLDNGARFMLTRDHKVYVHICQHGPACRGCTSTDAVAEERIPVGELEVGMQLAQPPGTRNVRVATIERDYARAVCWDISTDDHRVYLPEHDVTVSNCDDATRAMVALLLIVGINAAVVHQEFAETDHVLAAFETDDGRWMRVDPCYFSEIGQYHRQFVRETWIDAMTGHIICRGKECPMGLQNAPEAVILKARPLGDYVGVSGIGQLGDADPATQIIASWGIWLDSVDRDMVAARDAAMAAHTQMGAIRSALGLAVIDGAATGGEGQPPPAAVEAQWTQSWEDSYSQIVSMATLAHQYAQEAIAGKRDAHWVVDSNGGGQIALEQLPGDKVQLVPSSTGVSAIDIATGTALTGQISAVPVLLVVGVAAAAVVVYGSIYLTVRQLCEAIEAKQQAVTQRNLTDRASELVTSGKATPDQATAFVAAIGKSAPITASASQTEAAQNTSFSGNILEFGKIIVYGGLAVIAIGGIFYLIKNYGPAPKRGQSGNLLTA